jgi:hypothetical protein
MERLVSHLDCAVAKHTAADKLIREVRLDAACPNN